MVKTKKGRPTNNSSAKKRGPLPRTRARVERTKGKDSKSDEIDITSLADDDPTPNATRRTQKDFRPLMEDISSDDDSYNTPVDDTPRRGDDKKRQRFSEVMEIIEIEKDISSSSDSIQGPPAPLRLMSPQDDDSVIPPKVTIADILGEGPEEITRFHQPLIITKDCRYTLQLKVVACEWPSQFVAETFIGLYKWLQNKVGKELSVATWDDAEDKEKIYSKVQQLPKVTDMASWTSIWGNWISIKPQQEGTAFLKVRFVTKSPETLTKRLTDIGELRDEIRTATGISIGRLPIPCQAVQVGCAGWFFGSNKCINSDDLLREIRQLVDIPPHVRMGLSWRTIKLENGRTPPWIDNVQPASALHLDMDWFHAPVYKPEIARIFKKHGTAKPLGLTLRIIPCFSSDEGKNATTDQRNAAIEMRDKQEFLVKEHITVIKTPYILNLDKPTKVNGTMTLRRYLKNLHPQGLVAARLILSVDKAWQEGSKDTNIVTTREYAPQVQEAIRNMIPACVHQYGIGAKGWFTREGLHAFKNVQWDEKNQKSVSDMDIEAMRIVSEDFFGMGEAWRKQSQKVRRPKQATATSTTNDVPTQQGTPEASIPRTNQQPPVTAETLLADLANKKSDAPSFGDMYQRPHDGDTAKTSHLDVEEASISSHESDGADGDVTFTDIPDINTRKPTDGDHSTAKSSTHYRLQRDKSRALAEQSQEESRQLLAVLQREREELQQARQELEKLRVSQTGPNKVTPSAIRGNTGTAADSAGRHK
jgi:hypothetical protein